MMTLSERLFGPEGGWHFLRGFMTTIVLGLVVAIVIGVSSGGGWYEYGRFGLVVGGTIFVSIHTLMRLLDGWLSRLGRKARAAALILIFLSGGCIGWVLGFALGMLLFWGRTDGVQVALGPGLRLSLAVSGGLAIVVGLLFYTFDELRKRLEESIARVKESEYAERELELARSIQTRLLPPREVDGDGYRVTARNDAARFVAGDFYDVLRLDDGSVGLVIADVSGKGIGASLIMASVKAVLPFVTGNRAPSEVLRALNRKLAEELESRQFVALAFCSYEPSTGRFRLANAGMPDPWILAPNQTAKAVVAPPPRLPLGVRAGVEYIETEGTLEPGEELVFISDGIPESSTRGGEQLGYDATLALLSSMKAGWEIDDLFARVRERHDAAIDDDWTIVRLQRVPGDRGAEEPAG